MRALIFISWPVKAWSIPDEKVEELRARFPRVEFVHVRTLDAAAEAIRGVEVAFSPRLTAAMVASAPGLRWVHSAAAAVEGLLPLPELAARGIVVTNSRGIQAVAIAEHAMGALLVLSRKFDRTLAAQRERRWIQNDLTADWPWLLKGRRITVVGLGTIGTEIARRAHAFGMTVTGVRRHPNHPRPRFVERVLGTDQLGEAIAGADVLVLSAPGVAATQGMIGAAELARLAPGAILINVARAQIVDRAAMLSALGTGQLGGAALDVFEQEPLPPDDELWSAPNVVITPHASGFRATHWDDVVDLFADNLRRFRRGKPLVNVVDPLEGY